jgi:hypothetical protein
MGGRGVAVALRAAVWWLVREIKARSATDVSITAAARVRVSLEAIQNRFLRFISYKYNILRLLYLDYTPLLIQLNVISLAETKRIIDLKFLYNLVNDLINYPKLLNCLNFNVPERQTKSFYILFQKTSYKHVSPLNRLMKLANDDQVDLFNVLTFDGFCNFNILYI